MALATVLAGCTRAMARNSESSTIVASAIDVGFCQDMTLHHDQAILMSENVIGRASPRVRTLAVTILSGQSEEAGLMKGWLMLWGASQLSSAPMAWMHEANGEADASAMTDMRRSRMHGMASAIELAKLASERGRRLDVTFLQLMIRHHEAGIAMAEFAQTHSHNDLVRGIAAEMALDQSNETVLMRRLLSEDGGSPLPMN